MPEQPEFLFDIANGDPGISRQLRRSLETIRSATTAPDVRKQLDDVLAGRTSMREFGKSEVFAGIVDKVPQRAFERAASMSVEELEKLAARGQKIIEQLRRNPLAQIDQIHTERSDEITTQTPPSAPIPNSARGRVIPGTRKPNREQIVGPSDLDDDDTYYAEHQQRGWLV